MKLKSTTTNGFNLRIINSLMHNAFLGGGGYASPALTVNWICRRASPTSIWGSPPPGLTAVGATTRVFEKLVRYTDLSSDDCDIVRILISLDKQKGPYENPHYCSKRGEVVVFLVHIIHIMGWVVTMTRLTVVLSSSTFHLFNHLLISNLPVHQSCLPVNLKLLIW